MTDSLATVSVIESVVIGGDLSKLSPDQRVSYYKAVCDSIGLNPLTKPFDYITLKGKLTLYALKNATDQIRRNNEVSITKLERELIGSIYTVTTYAQDKTGRTDSALGAVSIEGLKGEDLANAFMKCETKSKRRVTLSICGLGMLDETEVETIPNAKPVTVIETGEIVSHEDPIVATANASIEVANAMSRMSSDKKSYGQHTDEQLGYMKKAISKKLEGATAANEQDELMSKLEDIDIILDWRKNNVTA